jgi:hypothetical protein
MRRTPNRLGAVGVVVLTTVAGAGAAIGLAQFIIAWPHISSFEGGAGYFAAYVTLFGIIGGAVFVEIEREVHGETGAWELANIAGYSARELASEVSPK